ncbi:conserved hypothetical protein [Ricinus communis]|uniref:Uncharacterized protein n=1 Tax=Ricinus communis TaxID=3988 RepID=B9SY47_RICCO|nr:conserved hypothetical protein [Ricinus communis]|eukprot:XP_002530916.1 uncharacterized protein LOC8268543 [Ricinus communis]
MKFLLELVSCCGSCNSSHKDIAEESSDGSGSSSSRRSEETRSLMVQRATKTIVSRKKKKRGRVGTTSPTCSGPMVDWQPTLSSISEDKVPVTEERAVKRKGSTGRGGGRARSHDIAYDDRRNHFMAIPTFSPTPFMI